MGPTAVGKSNLALQLAEVYNADIFSTDSRQIYKELNIGTAKPEFDELKLAIHHFINEKSIHDNYSAGIFEKEAITRLKEYFRSNRVAIMVGGTGLYIDAVLIGLDNFPKVDPALKIKVDQLIASDFKEAQKQLALKDPSYASQVDLKNSRRVGRALEVIYASGQTYSSFLNQEKPKRFFKVINVLLEIDRAALYTKINARVDKMIEKGLIEEVKSLLEFKNLKALQTVGYQELFPCFEEIKQFDLAIEEIKRNSRRYAKRQTTWFKKFLEPRFHPKDNDQILAYISKKLPKH